MFVKFSEILATNDFDRNDCFKFHPLQLSGLQEAVWELARGRGSKASPIVANPGIGKLRLNTSLNASKTTVSVIEPLRGLLRVLDGGILSDNGTKDLGNDKFLKVAEALLTDLHQGFAGAPYWHHLFYAYALENTGMERIFRRLLHLALHGESLGGFSEAGHQWLRATEDLIYRDGTTSFIPSITSSLRPDVRATRRNAYHRMFGAELNHGTDDNRPYPYEKAEAGQRADASNGDFFPTLEAFLREIWAAHTNASNSSGPKTTDKAAIAELAARMSEMLNDRRQHGNLTREEYASVCAMSWFHLTLYGYGSFNSPIVIDMKCEATSPEGRLRKLGERVGVPMHGKARSLFKIAELLSTLFIEIERGRYSDAANVDVLFDPQVGPETTSDMLTIITNWQDASGHNLKASAVNLTGR